MKQKPVLVIIALLGGLGGFLLRLYHNQTGYDPDTGLPYAGLFWPLPLLIAAAAVVVVFLLRTIPKERNATPFSVRFAASPCSAALLTAGTVLLLLSGACSIAQAAAGTPAQFLPGVLTVVCCVSLFMIGHGCVHRSSFSPNVLFIPVGYYVVELILNYRTHSVNPVLEHYYVEILALSCLLLVFYKFSAFPFGHGDLRQLCLWSAMATILACTAAADCLGNWEQLFFYAAGAFLSLFVLTVCHKEGYRPPGRHLKEHINFKEDSTNV